VPTAIKRLLYVGRLSEDKGVMTVLRALALLRGKLQCQLSVYGQGDPAYVARLKDFARDRRLDMNLTSGSLNEMPDIYRQHDLLLFPSEWQEPFALTPLEAMASGLPVIGTMTGGSAELFRERENALTYTAGKAEELAECIWEFASDHRLRSSCSRIGCEEARARYAAPVIVDQIERYLRETLEQWRAVPLPDK
jgi:glycosyltransferase involved in cell wall biosynthesis